MIARAGTPARPLLNAALWLAQLLLAAFFIVAGLTKLATAPAELARALAWTGDHPLLAKVTGAVDVVGGLGILLPALTRILPRLTLLAAVGLTILQLLAIAFHAVRGEAVLIGANLLILALILFVLWGRSRAVPIRPRS